MAWSSAWSGRSRGGLWPIRLVVACFAVLGPRRVHLLARPVALAVAVFMPALRRQVVHYQRRIDPAADDLTLQLRAVRQLAAFAAQLTDRGLVWRRERAYAWRGRGVAHLRRAVAEGGCILLGAHLGNWELATRLLGGLSSRRIHVVKVAQEDAAERALVDAQMRGREPGFIDPRDGVAAALAVQAAVAAGDIVCLLGDRVLPRQASQRVSFLGRPAHFPLGPFQLAAATGAPLLPCFLLRAAPGRYLLEIAPPLRLAQGPRRERTARLAAAAQHWAELLGGLLRRHPDAWLNFFYDFWAAEASSPSRKRSS